MPQTWNQFVKEFSIKHNISRKEAMKKASPAWQKLKASRKNTKVLKDVPEISEFPQIKKKKPTLKKPRRKKITVPSTRSVRASELGGAFDIHKPPSKRNKHQRRFRKHVVLQDSQFKFLAKQAGIQL